MSMLSRFATTGGSLDPYWANVTLMMPGNDFTDYSSNPKTITNNSAVISTSIKKYGTGSMDFTPTLPSYLVVTDNVGLNLSGGNYTIEGWIYPTVVNGFYKTIISRRVAGAGTAAAWEIFLNNNTGTLCMYANTTLYDSGVAPTANQWAYFVAVYSGSNLLLYLNGNRVLNTAMINTEYSGTVTQIGCWSYASEQYKGYLADLRITKGVARYTGSTMTVPTAPLPIG